MIVCDNLPWGGFSLPLYPILTAPITQPRRGKHLGKKGNRSDLAKADKKKKPKQKKQNQKKNPTTEKKKITKNIFYVTVDITQI